MVQQQWISGIQKVEQTKSADSLDVRYEKKNQECLHVS